jgi:hypothetical protein
MQAKRRDLLALSVVHDFNRNFLIFSREKLTLQSPSIYYSPLDKF